MNFALQHMKAATIFRDHVSRLESENADKPFGQFFEEVRSYGSACIMSATASLEALINELFIDPNLPLRKMLVDFESEFWGNRGIERKSILKKYQTALSMLQATALNEHTSPYRDAWALIELRNALIHYKPTWDPDRERTVELIEILNGKFPLSPFLDEGANSVTMKCMGSGCASWSVTTALTFMKEFSARSNLDPHKMSGFWKLEQ